MKTVIVNGHEVDMDAAVNLMDDNIRDSLHGIMAPCGDQEFIDAYCAAHRDKYGIEFEVV